MTQVDNFPSDEGVNSDRVVTQHKVIIDQANVTHARITCEWSSAFIPYRMLKTASATEQPSRIL